MPKKIRAISGIAFIFFGILFSQFFGVSKVEAVETENVFPPEVSSTMVYEESEDLSLGGEELDEYIVSQSFLTLEKYSGYTPTSNSIVLRLKIGISNQNNTQQVAIDLNGNGKFDDDGDEKGSWDSIINEDTPENDNNSGVFLEIGTGVDSSKTPNTLINDNNANDYDEYITGKFTNYSISDPEDPTKPGNYTYQGGKNIGYWIWGKNPTDPETGFFGKTERTVNIPVTGLTPGTYHTRIHISGDGTTTDAYSETFSFVIPETTSPEAENQSLTDAANNVAAQNTGDDAIDQLIDGKCEFSSPSSWFKWCLLNLYKLIYDMTAWFVGITGAVFDSFIGISISSTIYDDPSFIYAGWKIVRDLANIFFIFIMLFAAMGTILNWHHMNIKSTLAKVIIIALIVNFSLFFTRLAIDGSNILARVFYNEITVTSSDGTELPSKATVNEAQTGIETKSISAGVVGGLDIAKVVTVQPNFQAGFMWLLITFGIIVNLITAWTFLVVSLYFVGRILGLWFALIFSPMAFVTSIVPSIGKKFDKLGWEKWTENLAKLCIMAPIFALFLYLIVAFLQTDFLGDLVTNYDNLDTIEFFVSILLRFMLVIGLIQAAKKLAKDMSGEFGASVAGVAKGLAVAGGLALGGVALGAGALGRGLVRNPMRMATDTEARDAAIQRHAGKKGLSRAWAYASDGKYRSALAAQQMMQGVGDRKTLLGKVGALNPLSAGFRATANQISRTQGVVAAGAAAQGSVKPIMDILAAQGKIRRNVPYENLSLAEKRKVASAYNDKKRDEIAGEKFGGKKFGDLTQSEKNQVNTEMGARRASFADAGISNKIQNAIRETTGLRGAMNSFMVSTSTGSFDARNLPEVKNKFVNIPAKIIRAGFKKFELSVPKDKGGNFISELSNIFDKATEKFGKIKFGLDEKGGGHGGDHGGDHGGGHGDIDHHEFEEFKKWKKTQKKGGASH